MGVNSRERKAAMTAEEFKQAREALGMSQAELAREMGLSNVTVWRYESGETPITEDRAKTLRLMLSAAAAK